MRCNNCGWNNPDGASKCQKCNQPLVMESVPETEHNGASVKPIENHCPKCGYILAEGSVICPMCKTDIRQYNVDKPTNQSVLQESKKTIIIDKDKEEKIEKPVLSKQTVVVDKQSDSKAETTELASTKKDDLEVEQLHKTICDYSSSINAGNVGNSGTSANDKKVKSKSESEKAEFRYTFECMDSEERDVIELVSKTEMLLKEDEVILIAGLRFKRRR